MNLMSKRLVFKYYFEVLKCQFSGCWYKNSITNYII